MINRAALLLRYRAPAVQWINAMDRAANATPVTLAVANRELNVYLIDDAAGGSPDAFRRWLRRNYASLFELELEGWYTDRSLWPASRPFSLFLAWFEPEYHTVVIDTVGTAITDEEG